MTTALCFRDAFLDELACLDKSAFLEGTKTREVAERLGRGLKTVGRKTLLPAALVAAGTFGGPTLAKGVKVVGRGVQSGVQAAVSPGAAENKGRVRGLHEATVDHTESDMRRLRRARGIPEHDPMPTQPEAAVERVMQRVRDARSGTKDAAGSERPVKSTKREVMFPGQRSLQMIKQSR